MRISILHTPHCPSVSRLRADVEAVLERLGAVGAIEEIEGAYLSPTLLIDGAEMDGYPGGTEPACRVELPTREQILSAIARRGRGAPTATGQQEDRNGHP
ncbi:MAG TPA: hypothetical protein VE152_09980 [Acidimicrobiales bacterium]|nr:hypothetical protein [Acidimicrobiales bacterium]